MSDTDLAGDAPKRVLLIAYHFPPIKGSSGLERTLALVRHLPAHGWQPLVLTVTPNAYAGTSPERLASIPSGTLVHRAFAVDASSVLSLRGRYPSWAVVPDRWQSWVPTAALAGLRLIRRHRPAVIWSTYPIASAHNAAALLQRLSGLPWVADFRDPMVEQDPRTGEWYPGDERLRAARLRTEARVAGRAAAAVFCTEAARAIYAKRHLGGALDTCHVVPNGFDEDAFAGLVPTAADDPSRPIVIVHSGTIYPTADRDPSHFFRALAHVVSDRSSARRPVQVVLRGSGVDGLYTQLLTDLGLQDAVRFEALVPYRQALQEMLDADGLLLFQGYTSNPAVPAKLYEYFRAGRPILGLVDAEGETARALRQNGFDTLAPLDDADRIAVALRAFLAVIDAGRAKGLDAAAAGQYERRHASAEMAALFHRVAAG